MKNKVKSLFLLGSIVALIVLLQVQCTSMQQSNQGQMSQEQKIARGKYLVTIASCNDCHSPKVFTAMGPETDTTKLLSGHPAGSPLPPIDTNALHPGYWVTGGPDLTAWVGPWGISYTANLTPDSSTGIGAWSEEAFIATLRTGRHLGLSGGHQLLPPMPWNFIGQMTDDDLKSVFAYLRSLPAIRNQVPPPVAPPDVRMMAMTK